MILQTTVRDCLFLNWALPVEGLPPPPEPLRYQKHEWHGEEYVFASALLFRQEQLRPAGMPFPRLSYPQFNLRLCTLDDGGPSVLFLSIMVPGWVLPAARLFSRQPAESAHFNYPPIGHPNGEGLHWRVKRRKRLVLTGVPGSPQVGEGPSLGSWEETVNYFRHRPRGYVVTANGLDEIATTHRPADVCPLKVELQDTRLLDELRPQPEGGAAAWERPHSAWLCPEIRFVFELAPYRRATLPRQVTAPS